MQSRHRFGLFVLLVGLLSFACVSNEKTAQLARRDEIEGRMVRGEYLHDGSVELGEIGDIDSVPALLVVLKKHPPGKGGVMVCTTGHALTALRKLTGANPGITYEAWSDWWLEFKKSNQVSGRLEKTVNAGH